MVNLFRHHADSSLVIYLWVIHSFGGALSELDSLLMELNLPGMTVRGVRFGLQCVGNKTCQWATFFDPFVSDSNSDLNGVRYTVREQPEHWQWS